MGTRRRAGEVWTSETSVEGGVSRPGKGLVDVRNQSSPGCTWEVTEGPETTGPGLVYPQDCDVPWRTESRKYPTAGGTSHGGVSRS